MDLTLFFTQLLGVYVLVAGLSGLLYPDRAKRALEEVTKSYVIPYFDGALALIVGLIVVLLHNEWEGANAIIVTLFGWMAVFEGVAMLLLPQETIISIAKKFGSRSSVTMWSGVAIVLGGYLTYVGFFV